jgi:cytochrome bd-type quinol oxidase subunit 2
MDLQQTPVAQSPRRYNTLSIVSIILAVLSWAFTFLPTVFASAITSFVGLILSIVSIVQIKKRGEKGMVFAILALIITLLMLVVIILLFPYAMPASGSPASLPQ